MEQQKTLFDVAALPAKNQAVIKKTDIQHEDILQQRRAG